MQRRHRAFAVERKPSAKHGRCGLDETSLCCGAGLYGIESEVIERLVVGVSVSLMPETNSSKREYQDVGSTSTKHF